MDISQKVLGTMNGAPVRQFTLTNDRGSSIVCLSAAAAWKDFLVSGADGEQHALLFQFKDWRQYVTNPFHVGHSIGPVGGRIKDGCFTIGAATYRVPANERDNLIHGGSGGFSAWNWQAITEQRRDSVRVVFHRMFSPQDDGFPGTLNAQITYTLTNFDEVVIQFSGKSDTPTLFDPMTHVYFNLGDAQESILDHQLMIRSRRHIAVDQQKLPTGHFIENSGTAFDFSRPRILGDALKMLHRESGRRQFDDAFELTDGDQPAVVLQNSATHRQIRVTTDRNAVVVFTANPDAFGQSKEWEADHPFNALALEAQTLPDAVHYPAFGSIILQAGVTKTYTVRYRFQAI